MSQCLCTLDEYLDGHRHHCPDHKKCADCEEDEMGEHENDLDVVEDAEIIDEEEEEALPAMVLKDGAGVVVAEQPLGQVSIYRSMDADEQLAEARERARVLVEVIKEQNLSKKFSNKPGSKPHVFVEGWQFLASQFGLIPDIEWTKPLDNGWEARAALTRLSDGQVIAHAEGECRTSEDNWSGRPSYAVRSMAQTRAVSKVCRVALSSVMVMAGFSATPAEEIADLGAGWDNPYGDEPLTSELQPHCPACLAVHGTLVKVTGPHDRKPFWRCTADPDDCGGRREYNGKVYSWSGWRTSFENSVAEWKEGGIVKDDPKTADIGQPDDRIQRSDYIVDEIMGVTGLTSRADAGLLVKPGLIAAIWQGKIDAAGILGGELGKEISDEELRVIAVNLTLAEADEVVVAAAAAYAPLDDTKGSK